MSDFDNKKGSWFLEMDFSQLMDLRVDYAFKLAFGSGDTMFLISLLNAIFANKEIPRIIKSLTVANPYLEKRSKGDKLSIMDIRAQLDDGTGVLKNREKCDARIGRSLIPGYLRSKWQEHFLH